MPNVVSIPAADVPAITLRIADQAKMPPASTSTNGITIRIAANPSTTTQAHPDRIITFCSAHPKSPMRGCADWSAGILGLREITKARSIAHHNIAVVMGDLNSSTDHPSFRALLKSGFKDASLTQAAGPQPYVPPLAQVATHRAGSRAVYPRSAAITGQVVRNQGHRSSGTCRHAGASLAACRTSHPRDPLPRQTAHDTHHVSPALRAIIGQLFARAWRPLHPGPRGHVDSGGPCPTW